MDHRWRSSWNRGLVVAFAIGTQLTAGLTFAHAGGSAPAGPSMQSAELVRALRGGGYVVFLRHALTEQAQADTDRANLARCETQRNLSADGRRMAREIGEAFKGLDIRVGKVMASPYCRTVDTAQIAFGKHETTEALRYSVGVDQEQRARWTVEVKRLLGTVPAPGTNTVLVSHNGNLKEATGMWPKKEGDAHVFRPRPSGGFEYVGEVTAADWNCWNSKRSDCQRAASGS